MCMFHSCNPLLIVVRLLVTWLPRPTRLDHLPNSTPAPSLSTLLSLPTAPAFPAPFPPVGPFHIIPKLAEQHLSQPHTVNLPNRKCPVCGCVGASVWMRSACERASCICEYMCVRMWQRNKYGMGGGERGTFPSPYPTQAATSTYRTLATTTQNASASTPASPSYNTIHFIYGYSTTPTFVQTASVSPSSPPLNEGRLPFS